MIPSGAFSELPMLQSAELQENRIHEIAGNAFINVPHLLFLNLSHNLLTSLEHMGLESLRSLEVLDLSDNRINRVSSESLAAMEWLVELKVYSPKIITIPSIHAILQKMLQTVAVSNRAIHGYVHLTQ